MIEITFHGVTVLFHIIIENTSFGTLLILINMIFFYFVFSRSMELAMTATEPFNYFLLLRALFRSIGGGSHDLLYLEFLPLLPNLLEGLNRLQSGLHKQHMKDLFVELCLTVPVRLSSLLPYLPMLMDPLVSALNGSHGLISQVIAFYFIYFKRN